jgi:hypothetical protein
MRVPAKQRNELRRTAAFKSLLKVFSKGSMKKAKQNDLLSQLYHGDANAGIPSILVGSFMATT